MPTPGMRMDGPGMVLAEHGTVGRGHYKCSICGMEYKPFKSGSTGRLKFNKCTVGHRAI